MHRVPGAPCRLVRTGLPQLVAVPSLHARHGSSARGRVGKGAGGCAQ